MSGRGAKQDLSAYNYAAISSLVLTTDRSALPRRDKEPDGAPVSLAGRIDPKDMGSRVVRQAPKDLDKKKKKAAEMDSSEKAASKRRIESAGFGYADIIEATADVEGLRYRPRTAETRQVYELILSAVHTLLGDQAQDIVRSAADTVLETLKNDSMKDFDKKKEVEEVLGSVNNETFAQLVSLSKRIHDYDADDEEMADPSVGWILVELAGDHQAKNLKSEAMDVDEVKFAVGPKTATLAPGSTVQPKKINDLESMAFSQGGHLMSNKKCKLPDSSFKRAKKGYEEIHVPAPKQKPVADGELVPISSLPVWAREAFTVQKLNHVQSKLYPIAFGTDEPILLCAPTGAGKTNVAILTILNELSKYRDEETGAFDLDSFKIVYIAPMKALVQEMVGNFTARLKVFGVKVGELTGDSQMTKQQIAETQVIVTTPEKYDVVTRTATDTSYINLVRLIIIDEIHLLHDERGPVLESIVATTIRRKEQTGEYVRLVGLSATLPNYQDVATFLRVDEKKGLFYFDASYRPCGLQQQFIGAQMVDLPIINTTKSVREWSHEWIARALCPLRDLTEFDSNPSLYMKKVRDGTYRLHAHDLPSFLFPDNTKYNAKHKTEGLMRGHVLISALCAVYTGESLAFTVILESNRESVAEISKIREVTPYMAASVACQVYVVLSSLIQWHPIDSNFNIERFRTILVEPFIKHPNHPWVKETLQYLTDQLPGLRQHQKRDNCALGDDGDPTGILAELARSSLSGPEEVVDTVTPETPEREHSPIVDPVPISTASERGQGHGGKPRGP